MRLRLNLLPPPYKAALRQGVVLAFVRSMLTVFLITAAFAAGTLTAVRLEVQRMQSDLTTRGASNSNEFKEVGAEIAAMNGYLKRLDGLRSSSVRWSQVISGVTALVPPGMTLDRIAIDPQGNISLSGMAAERSSVLLLEKRLRESPSYKNVNAPLSNILTQKDVKFEFSMTYVPPAGSPAVAPPAAAAGAAGR
ncbi:MAG: hypothetical protein RLZZ324_1333 [Candidatus Parcubacteria bacterium]|jgi:Tfp pilus assembly protein PilN